ncbi:adenylosuccinate synthase [Halobacteriales archaeon QH_7_68_42]|nr:MAG: adenylosuccinate synthase [Halobacteriales archaeon QH_7_68_42]
MTATIVGAQLGDEGKGGIVDVYGDDADVVVRYQGGDNAGHTVVHEGTEYKLSLVPSGAVRGKVNVLGNGCVVNPGTLFEEIDALRDRGVDPDVRVARRAHVIFPYHRVLDGIEEEAKSETDDEVGTTGRGIGPTYEDKAGRRGLRIGDLTDPEVLRERLEYVVPIKRTLAEDVFGVEVGEERETASPSPNDEADEVGLAFDVEALYEEYREYGERLVREDMLVDAGDFLARRIDDGANVMFEGAQGTIIDIDHGNYPYVELGGVPGDTPGYDGDPENPETESEELAAWIREEGDEYGTVTGRPRRVGWLDIPMLRHAARASGFTGLAVNHVDTLAGLDEVKVGHSYTLDTDERSSSSNRDAGPDDGEETFTMPAVTGRWAECEPNLRTFEGWPEFDGSEVAEAGYEALPENARVYLEYLEDELDTPVYAVGVGPARTETVVRHSPF